MPQLLSQRSLEHTPRLIWGSRVGVRVAVPTGPALGGARSALRWRVTDCERGADGPSARRLAGVVPGSRLTDLARRVPLMPASRERLWAALKAASRGSDAGRVELSERTGAAGRERERERERGARRVARVFSSLAASSRIIVLNSSSFVRESSMCASLQHLHSTPNACLRHATSPAIHCVGSTQSRSCVARHPSSSQLHFFMYNPVSNDAPAARIASLTRSWRSGVMVRCGRCSLHWLPISIHLQTDWPGLNSGWARSSHAKLPVFR